MSETRTSVIFGGSLGIGEATAALLAKQGDAVTIVGRDAGRLAAAAERIGGVKTAVADARDRDAVSRVFEATGSVDTVVVCVGGSKGIGRFLDIDLHDVMAAFEEKAFAQLLVTQVAANHMKPKGSITLVTAGSARSVTPGAVGPATVNGALESAIPTLAAELAPIRVNAVSPGLIDTPLWDFMPDDARQAFFDDVGSRLPVGRVGRPQEVADVIALVARNAFVSGATYVVDGGTGAG
ncbi:MULTISPECIES: SDR family oxidoreductase [Rhodopseudomonas]|uniref:Short-chain dehydrogenase/reductase SDR n=1 Tax=Rhodopseudomonas palustris TaxID=1076 RepID=A0A0D7F6I8_RHOPL|nr:MULTISPECIES: SDR family oxidoreductase [Rhodopseudomonas]KIZ47327.1 hypothetical protein OO17_04935 [Rhodopseudomonas palustris]MDF3812894.1 SDR family oxidoreductase [Rhodopseudomonas sp. BAL398]WOK18997.1 SDR family oxidoreductase [Rhodopseudomonas sp. BAL398]